MNDKFFKIKFIISESFWSVRSKDQNLDQDLMNKKVKEKSSICTAYYAVICSRQFRLHHTVVSIAIAIVYNVLNFNENCMIGLSRASKEAYY